MVCLFVFRAASQRDTRRLKYMSLVIHISAVVRWSADDMQSVNASANANGTAGNTGQPCSGYPEAEGQHVTVAPRGIVPHGIYYCSTTRQKGASAASRLSLTQLAAILCSGWYLEHWRAPINTKAHFAMDSPDNGVYLLRYLPCYR